MVTQIRQVGTRRHLYILEWMEKRGLSDQTLGDRLDVSRQTVYRWRTQQHRLDPAKMEVIAEALDIKPEQLWRRPERPSIDALLERASPEQIADTAAFVERFVLKRGA